MVFDPERTCPTTKFAVPPGIVTIVGAVLANVMSAAPVEFAATSTSTVVPFVILTTVTVDPPGNPPTDPPWSTARTMPGITSLVDAPKVTVVLPEVKEHPAEICVPPILTLLATADPGSVKTFPAVYPAALVIASKLKTPAFALTVTSRPLPPPPPSRASATVITSPASYWLLPLLKTEMLVTELAVISTIRVAPDPLPDPLTLVAATPE